MSREMRGCFWEWRGGMAALGRIGVESWQGSVAREMLPRDICLAMMERACSLCCLLQ